MFCLPDPTCCGCGFQPSTLRARRAERKRLRFPVRPEAAFFGIAPAVVSIGARHAPRLRGLAPKMGTS
jgi:hypothetical protein